MRIANTSMTAKVIVIEHTLRRDVELSTSVEEDVLGRSRLVIRFIMNTRMILHILWLLSWVAVAPKSELTLPCQAHLVTYGTASG